MIKRLSFIVILVSFALALVYSIGYAENKLLLKTIGTKIGQKAPYIKTVELGASKIIESSDFLNKGDIVIINFWASWCPYSVSEMPNLEKIKNEFSNVAVVAIDRAEPKKDALDFIKSLNISYLLLSDSDDAIANIYGVTVMPTTYFLKPNGMIGYVQNGEVSLSEMRSIINKLSVKDL